MQTGKMLTLIFALNFLFTGLNAKIWIVDNNAVSAGDFTTLADAQTNATSGDTIFVYPSATTYTGINVIKQLFIFGVGYNLDIYNGQASNATANIGTMNFNAGSEGSLLEGLNGNFYVDVNTTNITIKRNNLNNMQISNSNCVVIQNDISGSTNFGSAIWINQANLGGILIANNKIRNTSAGDNAIYSNATSEITVVNNVIKGESVALANLSTTSLIQNNIILKGSVGGSAVFQFNMSQSNQLPSGNGNLINVDMTTVFENPNDFVNGLHLLANSPASGTGFGGADMGIYSGDGAYVDGGFPGLPSIFHFESEAITTPQNGLDVVIKVKSNRE